VHARVSTYDLAPEKLDEGIAGFREAMDRIRDLEGLHEALVLVDRENAQAVTITVWDDAQSMTSSRVAASRARSDAARAADGEVKSSSEYEIVIRERGSRGA
jgi:heme-degrading monooxygenase HmoA